MDRALFGVRLAADAASVAAALAGTDCPPPRTPPTIVSERRRYTRIAYLHLGKLDCLNALGGLLAAVASVDRLL